MFFISAFGFLSIIILLQWINLFPSIFWGIGVLLSCLFLFFIRNYFFRIIVVFFIGASIGQMYLSGYWEYLNRWKLPDEFINKPVLVEGKIVSLPSQQYQSSHFLFQLNQFSGEKVNALVQLSWYGQQPLLLVNDRWRWWVKLKPPHGLQNPGGFDYAAAMKKQGIVAKGYVVTRMPFILISREKIAHSLSKIREYLQQLIQKSIQDPNLAAIITALTVGSTALMTPDLWKVFQNTGTTHLISISGLHVGLLAGMVYAIALWIYSRFSRLVLRIPAPKVAGIAGLMIAIFYAILAGFSVPTLRSIIMLSVVILGEFSAYSIPFIHRFWWAFLLISVLDPFSLSTASFWLSFIAIASLNYLGSGRIRHQNNWKSGLKLQILMTIALLPLTIWYFQQFPWMSLFANIIAIPWMGFVIVPLGLLGILMSIFSISIAKFLLMLTGKLLWPLWEYLLWISHQPHVLWHHAMHNMGILISVSIGVAWILAPKGWPARSLGWLWILPLFFYKPVIPLSNSVWLTVLDVGQGLSAVIQTQHHVLIYDTGPRSPFGFDAGQEVLVPFLLRQNITNIDLLMVSHGDNDHRGGAATLLSIFPVKSILTSAPHYWPGRATACQQGQHWVWDGVNFTVLWPKNAADPYDGNNSSCVLSIRTPDHGILLVGDIEHSVEALLVKQYGQQLSADVLVSPHHGSRTSSSLAFVEAVKPREVVFPTGYFNRYRFPSKIVVQRYRDIGATLYNTAITGAVTVKLENNKVEVNAKKNQ